MDEPNADRTPKKTIPRKLRYKLYLSRILSAWGDRMWQFAIGLYFIKLYPGSFMLAAIHGIVSSVLVFMTAPLIGSWIERTSRFREIQISLLLQNGFVALGAVCVAVYEIESIDRSISQWVSWIGLIAFAIISQIWSVGFTTCLEKDWILCIATDNKQLTGNRNNDCAVHNNTVCSVQELNAVLRRLDLTCNVVAPSVVGAIMNQSLLWSAVFLALWNLCSAVLEYTLLRSIFVSVPRLREPKAESLVTSKVIDLSAFAEYWKSFLWPGFSFSLLYLTVLGFDSITIGYASEKGVNEMVLGLVTVAGSIVGVSGTLLYPTIIGYFGVKTTALIGFVSELICLTLCLVDSIGYVVAAEVVSATAGIILLLTGITLARFGLWVADMAVNQLIQTESESPPKVASVQTSVNILMEMIKFIVVLCVPRVDQFYILSILSYLSVMIGAILFAGFVLKGLHNSRNADNDSKPQIH